MWTPEEAATVKVPSGLGQVRAAIEPGTQRIRLGRVSWFTPAAGVTVDVIR